MRTGQLQRVVADYRAMLAAREQQALRTLAEAHARTIAQTIQPQLDILFRAVEARIQSGETIPVEWLLEGRRLQTIETLIQGQIDHYAALAQMTAGQMQHQGVMLGTRAAQELLQASVPPGIRWAFGIPDPSAIANIVGSTKAGPLADLFNGFGLEAAQGAKNALIAGLTTGVNPRLVAEDVQAALNVSQYRAQTIARTEMLRAYRDSQIENYRANSDVVSQWRWTCDLSARTCAACLAMDGELFSLDDGMDTHVNCRCTQVPVTKSWSDILSGAGIDASGIDDTSSIDGWQSGADWFAKQPADVQQGILGKQAYQLYQDGTIDLSDMVTQTHDPQWGDGIQQTTVKELSKRK